MKENPKSDYAPGPCYQGGQPNHCGGAETPSARGDTGAGQEAERSAATTALRQSRAAGKRKNEVKRSYDRHGEPSRRTNSKVRPSTQDSRPTKLRKYPWRTHMKTGCQKAASTQAKRHDQ